MKKYLVLTITLILFIGVIGCSGEPPVKPECTYVSDGLEIKIISDKRIYKKNDEIVFTISMKNITNKEIVIFWDYIISDKFVLCDTKGNVIPCARVYFDKLPRPTLKNNVIVINPNNTIEKTIEGYFVYYKRLSGEREKKVFFSTTGLRHASNLKGIYYIYYQLEQKPPYLCEYAEILENKVSEYNIWHGRAISNTIEIEIQ